MKDVFNNLQEIASPNYKEVSKPADIINDIVPYFFAIAGILLIFYLIIGGLSLMTSQGDPKKIQDAQGKITGALVGLGIVLFAYVFVIVIGRFFGVELIGTS